MHALNILDRYLLREYLKAFVVGLVFFIALIVIVRLLDYDLKKFEDDISYIIAVKIVLYQAPRRIMEMVPIAGFVAVFFTLGRMVRSNEFTAMKAGGISVYRLLAPILIVTLIICGLFAIFYNRVASPAFHEAHLLQNKVKPQRGRNVVFRGKNNRVFYSQRIALDAQKINQLTIYEYGAEDRLDRITFAKSATWTSTHWDLTDGYIRHFAQGVEVDYETFDTYTIERHEDPARFIGSEKDPRAMTIKELREQIAYKQEAGQISRKEQVKLYHKTAYPFAAVVVVMLGAPIAIRFGRAGFFAGLVIAFFLSFIYWALSFATLEGLSENGKLHPFLACWGANILYAAVGSILIWRTPK
ncbi:MAG: LptF/LptG family permease [Candidatus Poribacteria bacterium]|nr:LptF/LptG family permease [Candidatus Poribacteria bacterium]